MQNTSPSPRRLAARWPLLATSATVIALIVVVVFLVTSLPPRRVVMATGPEDSTYHAIGKRYREFFARHRVKLELRPTNGTVDNVELLRDPNSGVDIALIQGGITDSIQVPTLVSLGSMFYEPFWIFTTVPQEDRTTDLLERVPVSLGAPGSGTYRLAREVLAATGLDEGRMDIRDLGPVKGGEALLRGEVQLVGMSLPWDAPIVQRLLRDPNVDALSWTRANALVALSPFLSKVSLPRGVADLANDRPPYDVTLVATTASLVVREDLHPALQHLLLEAASKIHNVPSVFNKAREFPTAESVDLPLSDIAHEYYRSGQPLLQRYLPFWLAAFTSRLLVLLIPIIGVGYPLFRLLPALFGWSMRHRVLPLVRGAQVPRSSIRRSETRPKSRPVRATRPFGTARQPHARAKRIRANALYLEAAHRHGETARAKPTSRAASNRAAL
ncbi:MAG: C4-dicarboxylate ABC transporter substrate-binding protein [Betaproteobacteria bacterium]|nr:MAG: C4-dicarboxylate ABC transporter substrate-binding protein [Betaproteobacteria bacterium]